MDEGTNVFEITPLARFAGTSAAIKRPTVIFTIRLLTTSMLILCKGDHMLLFRRKSCLPVRWFLFAVLLSSTAGDRPLPGIREVP